MLQKLFHSFWIHNISAKPGEMCELSNVQVLQNETAGTSQLSSEPARQYILDFKEIRLYLLEQFCQIRIYLLEVIKQIRT